MQTLLLIHGDESGWATMSEAQQGAAIGAYMAYTQALAAEGILRGGEQLMPAATGRILKGTTVLDGPYTETKEQLGGFYLLETPDLATAEAWAARCPALHHGATIELRPLVPRG